MAWKGGKQFHANKGWTIGECCPPPSVALPLSVSEPGHSFSTGIKQEEGCFFFCADYWMLFEAFPKGWSYSEKGFLFLWCSSIIHRPFFNGFGLSVGRITETWLQMNNIIVIVSIQRTVPTEQGVLKTDKKKKKPTHTDTNTEAIWILGLQQHTCMMHSLGWAGDRKNGIRWKQVE